MSLPERDYYYTISLNARAPEIKVSGSRFIADLVPVASKDAVEAYLFIVSKEFYDASHHCYAYRLGNLGDLVRASDDGEPSGTAGKPILSVLVGAELTNVLCVVTRYFGGTKLGTGGLARAYSEAAQLAVQHAVQKQVLLTKTILLNCSYEELAMIERLLSQYELRPYESEYGERISMKLDIRLSLIEKFLEELHDKFFGKVIAQRI